MPVQFPAQLGLLRWALIQASKSYSSSQLPLGSGDVFILAACFSDVPVSMCAQQACFTSGMVRNVYLPLPGLPLWGGLTSLSSLSSSSLGA